MKMLSDIIRKKSEMQIAPLIDVVFLLLIYFMVTASLIRNEADMSFALPAEPGPVKGIPIEVLIELTGPGDILIEGMQFEKTDDLVAQLASLKASADLSGSDFIVSIHPSDKTLHGRVVAVMDACAAAKVDHLSFCM